MPLLLTSHRLYGRTLDAKVFHVATKCLFPQTYHCNPQKRKGVQKNADKASVESQVT